MLYIQRQHLLDVRNLYALVTDVLQKNYTKICKPKTGDPQHMCASLRRKHGRVLTFAQVLNPCPWPSPHRQSLHRCQMSPLRPAEACIARA